MKKTSETHLIILSVILGLLTYVSLFIFIPNLLGMLFLIGDFIYNVGDLSWLPKEFCDWVAAIITIIMIGALLMSGWYTLIVFINEKVKGSTNQ